MMFRSLTGLLAAVMVAGMLPLAAVAQPYDDRRPPPYDRGYDRDYDRDYDRRDRDRDYDRRDRDQYRRDRDRDYDRRDRGQRAGPRGSVCVTSRGNCPTGIMLPPNSPCQCDIPGFGKKRGGVAY